MRIIALFPSTPAIDSYPAGSGVIWRRRSYCVEADFHNGLGNGELEMIMERSFQIHLPGNLPIYVDGMFNFQIFAGLWSEEAYWEIHEMLEYEWRKSDGKIRRGLWLLIQVVVSQIKWQMNQEDVSRRIIARVRDEFWSLFGHVPLDSYPVQLTDVLLKKIRILIQSNI